MEPISHPGRLLKRELQARQLSANRLALNLGVPSGRITDILNGRRSITADTALRLGRYFGNSPRFWLDLQSQYDLAALERERGGEISPDQSAARRRRHLIIAADRSSPGCQVRSEPGRAAACRTQVAICASSSSPSWMSTQRAFLSLPEPGGTGRRDAPWENVTFT